MVVTMVLSMGITTNPSSLSCTCDKNADDDYDDGVDLIRLQ